MFLSRRAAAVASAVICLMASPAPATTFITTKLSDLAARSSAVIQGDLIATETLADTDGVPWTIYTVSVQAMLAGEFSGKEFRFRCIGGQIGNEGLSLAGAPRLTVGDSLVLFYAEGNRLCQIAGLEHGVFWRRKSATGNERLVNFEGRAIAGLGIDGPIFSGEKIVSAFAGSLEGPESLPGAPSDASKNSNGLPPSAEASTILDELVSFAATHVTRPRAIVSTTDLTGVPQIRSARSSQQ